MRYKHPFVNASWTQNLQNVYYMNILLLIHLKYLFLTHANAHFQFGSQTHTACRAQTANTAWRDLGSLHLCTGHPIPRDSQIPLSRNLFGITVRFLSVSDGEVKQPASPLILVPISVSRKRNTLLRRSPVLTYTLLFHQTPSPRVSCDGERRWPANGIIQLRTIRSS